MVLLQREGNQEAETGGANVCTDYHQQVQELINHEQVMISSLRHCIVNVPGTSGRS